MKIRILILTLFIMNCFAVVQEMNGQPVTERVYLHTDRESYVAGDHLLYSLFRKGDPASRYAYLIIRDQNGIAANVRLELSGNTAYGAVLLPDTLRSGFYQILCFTNVQRNAPETFWKKEIVISNRFDNDLKSFTSGGNEKSDTSAVTGHKGENGANVIVLTAKERFSPREKILFSIESQEFDEDDLAEISVSVSEVVKESVQVKYAPEILNPTTKGSAENINLIYEPEVSGSILSGKVMFSTVPGNVVFVSTIDTVSNLQYARTDSSGVFSMLLNPYYFGKELVIRLKDDMPALLKVDNRIEYIPPFIPSGQLSNPGLSDYMKRMGQIATLRKYYNHVLKFDTIAVLRASSYIPRLYYSNFTRIIPSDYVELKDFSEISTEIIPALRVRKTKNNYVVSYPYLKYATGTNDAPAIFFNGVPVDDIDQFVNSGSREIWKIETLPVTRFFGDLKFDGILSVFSYDLNRKITFKAPSVFYRAELSEPYVKPVEFMQVNPREHQPDLRQVLLWEPHITVKAKKLTLECYASDIKGTYRISVNGITKNGVPLGGSATINIE